MSAHKRSYEEEALSCLYKADKAIEEGHSYELSMYWVNRAQVWATLATMPAAV